jgi:citrate lyase beta subunit
MGTARKARFPRRSLLFTPGDSMRKILKAAQVGADTIILDLEDAVPAERKGEARDNVVKALEEIAFDHTERLVRINATDTAWFDPDLKAVASTKIDGIVLPKVEMAEQIRRVDDYLMSAEIDSDLAPGSIGIFALIETALGLMNIKDIARSSERLVGLIFGAEDFSADLGATRTDAGWEILFGRSAVVTASAAFGLEAIDTVYLDFKNRAGLEKEARFARQLGFTGKLAIHPGQNDVLNRVFSPSASEIAQAKRIVEAYQTHAAEGVGVFTLDGRMIDKPIIRTAERILERAGWSSDVDQEPVK